MDKKEIYSQLVDTGQVNRKKKTPLWTQAFNLYEATTKNTVAMTCGKCYDTVLQWLKKS